MRGTEERRFPATPEGRRLKRQVILTIAAVVLAIPAVPIGAVLFAMGASTECYNELIEEEARYKMNGVSLRDMDFALVPPRVYCHGELSSVTGETRAITAVYEAEGAWTVYGLAFAFVAWRVWRHRRRRPPTPPGG